MKIQIIKLAGLPSCDFRRIARKKSLNRKGRENPKKPLRLF